MAKYPDLTQGQIEAAINKLGGMEGLKAFLADEAKVVAVPPFPKNEHGHYLISVEGCEYTTSELLFRFRAAGLLWTDDTEKIFPLIGSSYDDFHRLFRNKTYTAVLVPNSHFDDQGTEEQVREFAEKFGYRIAPAGIIPSLHFAVTSRHMERMGASNLIAFPDNLRDEQGKRYYMQLFRHGPKFLSINELPPRGDPRQYHGTGIYYVFILSSELTDQN